MKLQNFGISNKVIVQYSDSVYIINKYNPNSSSTGKQNIRELVRKYWSFHPYSFKHSLSQSNPVEITHTVAWRAGKIIKLSGCRNCTNIAKSTDCWYARYLAGNLYKSVNISTHKRMCNRIEAEGGNDKSIWKVWLRRLKNCKQLKHII